jgi:hypothetical protein
VAAAGASAVPSALALVMLVLAALVLIAWLTNRSGAAARDA